MQGSNMPTSVMPKGVEHLKKHGRRHKLGLMPTSVMPKGVEHIYVRSPLVTVLGMPTSVMPKGVEHGGQKRDRSDIAKSGEFFACPYCQ